MASKVLAIVLFILISFEYPKAEGALSSWANRVIDCGVSVWSAWGPWSGSDPGATRTRSRVILRLPQNGGAPCPSLTETGVRLADPWIIKNVTTVATTFHNDFLTGSSYRDDALSRRRRQTTIEPRDTLFIIDMSGSISYSDYTLAKTKLAELLGEICGGIGPGAQNNRVAVITFSSRVVLNFNFQTYWTIESVQQAILNMPRDAGGTCTGDAIAYAHQYMFASGQGLRPSGQSNKEVLVITDGGSNCGANITIEAGNLKLKAFVFALSIGVAVNVRAKAEIESMVSDPLAKHIFALQNFEEFADMVDTVVNSFSLCVPYEV